MNNRVIKFRAWNGLKMVTPSAVNEYGWYETDRDFEDGRTVNFENLMQFTGLKDKNGKEIYEGDILRWPPSEDWEINNYAAFEVFFHDNDACEYNVGFQMNRMHFHGAVAGGMTHRFKPSTTKKLQIIGNIYENPDLLTS